MIVVVEGIDRVGKTTLVKKLVNAGFIDMKDEFILKHKFFENFSDYSLGKCDSFVAIAKKLNDEGKNVVIDRLHITEMVYGKSLRHETRIEGCFALDMELANMGAILCYIRPTSIRISNELAGVDQTERNELFEHYVNMSSMRKVKGDFD